MPVWSLEELRRSGVTRHQLRRLVDGGRLRRVRVGWYADATADREVFAAIRCGGTQTCRAALRRHGVWVTSGTVPPHARLEPHARRHDDMPIHRSTGDSEGGIDEPVTALRAGLRCLPDEESVCAIDSILNSKLASRARLERELTTPGARRLLALADGRAQSGLETLARLRLRSRGLKIRVQVPIPPAGRVDLLVGDRLVIELDGDEWHSTRKQREEDRRRDSALVARGYLVMRAGYHRVLDDWDAFEREVLTVVRRREHRWRAVHRVGRNSGPRTVAR
jgi:very-short-patch-repair endonuclease